MPSGVMSIGICLLFNLTDLLSGIVVAVKRKQLKSSKLRDGVFKKVGFIICYFLAWLVDNEGHLIGFSLGVKVLPILVLYVALTELVSILENVAKINPKLTTKKLFEIFHLED